MDGSSRDEHGYAVQALMLISYAALVLEHQSRTNTHILCCVFFGVDSRIRSVLFLLVVWRLQGLQFTVTLFPYPALFGSSLRCRAPTTEHVSAVPTGVADN